MVTVNLPRFIYTNVNDPAIRYIVTLYFDPVTKQLRQLSSPRKFIYTRTTSEAVLGLYEYEYLDEEPQQVSGVIH